MESLDVSKICKVASVDSCLHRYLHGYESPERGIHEEDFAAVLNWLLVGENYTQCLDRQIDTDLSCRLFQSRRGGPLSSGKANSLLSVNAAPQTVGPNLSHPIGMVVKITQGSDGDGECVGEMSIERDFFRNWDSINPENK